MAFDTGLADRIRDLLQCRTNVTERKMFGGIAFMLNGHMFIGIRDDTLMARVGPDGYDDALARPHTREMDFTGRPMKGYVYVGPSGIESESGLQEWVDRCAGFVATLPPK